MNSYWVAHTGSENHCETTKLLKTRYIFTVTRSESIVPKISDVEELKWRINREWAGLSHTVIEYAVSECRQRLRAWTRAGGGHFDFWAHVV